ncbi:MAG: 3-phosphoshikimate 1-carboxyvinyltransferase [Acutalibacteraceae bacterium]
MKVKVYPSVCTGEIQIPPSKSMAHRAIMCASLAKGKSVISNIAYSDDILATIAGMRALGASITMEKDTVVIEGIQSLPQKPLQVDCNESGSTLRFFVPLFTLSGQPITFLGRNRLLKRPQGVYQTMFEQQGHRFDQTEQQLIVQGALKAGSYEIDGSISSQFITGLLFALPLLEQDSIIHIKPPFESRSYIELTLQMLKTFGVTAEFQDNHTLYIPGNQSYQACDYTVEGDYSQMAFYAVLAAIQNDLYCKGVTSSSKQGDKVILSILEDCNCKIESKQEGYLVHKSELTATEIDLEDCPDLGPVLNVLGMYAKGTTRIYHAARLRYKESDRIAAMEEELKKFHTDITTTEDEIFIKGKPTYCCEQELSGHTDHRIVMSMTVAALCSETPVIINGAECINKSYPNFFEDIQSIGGRIEVLEP